MWNMSMDNGICYTYDTILFVGLGSSTEAMASSAK